MNENTTAITDDDLHAYADGLLSDERHAEVEAYLRDNPEAARTVRSYIAINQGLHKLFDDALTDPVPAQMLKPLERRKSWWCIPAAAAVVGLAFATGWFTKAEFDRGSPPVMADLVNPAAFAHAVFAEDKTHPVEISSDQTEHLVKWLSNRLDTPLQAPDLHAEGFRLLGGRLLPSTGRMAAQFMYEDARGLRVTLYQRKGDWGERNNAFGYAFHDGVAVLFWTQGQMGYALSGALSKSKMLDLAVAIPGAPAVTAAHL